MGARYAGHARCVNRREGTGQPTDILGDRQCGAARRIDLARVVGLGDPGPNSWSCIVCATWANALRNRCTPTEKLGAQTAPCPASRVAA